MSRDIAIQPGVWQMVERIAPTMHKARLFGVASPEQAAAIMLKGYELGLGLTASFEFIQVVEGKPSLSPRGALALIHRSGELAALKIVDQPDRCTVTMKRKSGTEYSLVYTLDDAKAAGVVKPGGNWAKYQANMLRWRCIGFVADVVFPDLLGGLKRSDELGMDVDDSGETVTAQWNGNAGTTTYTPAPVEIAPPTVVTLDELVNEFGGEAVIIASEGRIPASDEEVATVAAILRG